MATIWTGTISFGLVTVPIKLVPATKNHDISFNQLDSETGERIRYKRMAEKSGSVVPNENIVKGYEIEPDKYVVISPQELKTLSPKTTQTIDIDSFVDLDEIDPIYFESPYYATAQKKAEKPYALLVDAMEKMHKVAVGRFVLRDKEHLVAIRPIDGVLCIETMRYADEVEPAAKFRPELTEKPTEKELKMAQQLIETLAATFDPEQFHDEYRNQVLDLIEKKKVGEEIVATPQEEEEAQVVDLMEALEASVKKAKAKAS